MLNKVQNVQVSDTTEVEQNSIARSKNISHFIKNLSSINTNTIEIIHNQFLSVT
jgi:hypothetical protein